MFEIPLQIKQIFTLFKNSNKEMYLVGGAVRDFLMGKQVSDFDLITNATPKEIKDILKDYSLITSGEALGSFKILLSSLSIQINTYRIEKFSKVHYPSKIIFTSQLQEDLLRRDFTINALCYDLNEIFDFHQGLRDLKKKQLRLIGNKENRFKEDPLRILRAIRLAVNLNLKIEKKTLKQLKKDLPLIEKLNKNLIKREIKKIDLSKTNPLLNLIEKYL